MTAPVDPPEMGGISRRTLIASAAALTGLTVAGAKPSVARAVAQSAAGDQASDFASHGAPRLTPIVETTDGKVRGYIADGICTFRGLRYGERHHDS